MTDHVEIFATSPALAETTLVVFFLICIFAPSLHFFSLILIFDLFVILLLLNISQILGNTFESVFLYAGSFLIFLVFLIFFLLLFCINSVRLLIFLKQSSGSFRRVITLLLTPHRWSSEFLPVPSLFLLVVITDFISLRAHFFIYDTLLRI
jgi:hypothetical protein